MKPFMNYLMAGALGGAVFLGGQFLLKPSASSSVQSNHVNEDGTTARYVSEDGNGSGAAPIDFTGAAEVATPAVVHITSIEEFQARNESERRFYYFFGEPSPRQSTGSGVIIAKDGYIVTNNHVINGATKVSVTLADKRKFAAKVIGADPSTDLAVIKIEEQNLPTINFGNSDNAKVGQWVIAVGNPFNLASTVTAGIISAKGRNINIIEGQRPVESFIQTDAAVNPGNSGGALVDLNGNLVGINTAISSPTGAYSGYAFAVPANLVKKVVSDLMDFGSVHRAMMGVNIADLNEELAKANHVSLSEGVYIQSVQANGGAAAAGLKGGDVVTAIEGTKISSVAELQEKIASRNPGDVVRVTVFRDGSHREVQVKLQ